VGLERGPLSLVSTIEELLGRNSCACGLENWVYGRGDLLRLPRDTLYLQKLALTSPTCGSPLVGIFRLWTKTTEFLFVFTFQPRRWREYFLWSISELSLDCMVLHPGRILLIVTPFFMKLYMNGWSLCVLNWKMARLWKKYNWLSCMWRTRHVMFCMKSIGLNLVKSATLLKFLLPRP
jgi:hypothetical protein